MSHILYFQREEPQHSYNQIKRNPKSNNVTAQPGIWESLVLLWTAKGSGGPTLPLQASPALPPIAHTCMHRNLRPHTKRLSGSAGSTPQLPPSFMVIPQFQPLYYARASTATEVVPLLMTSPSPSSGSPGSPCDTKPLVLPMTNTALVVCKPVHPGRPLNAAKISSQLNMQPWP